MKKFKQIWKDLKQVYYKHYSPHKFSDFKTYKVEQMHFDTELFQYQFYTLGDNVRSGFYERDLERAQKDFVMDIISKGVVEVQKYPDPAGGDRDRVCLQMRALKRRE